MSFWLKSANLCGMEEKMVILTPEIKEFLS